ncbi:MAG: alpha-ketoglutarate-dependent dioxygenase AlkB [Dongiaceae bacterium]
MSFVTRPIVSRRVRLSRPDQADLFGDDAAAPEGFVYRDEVITAAEEATLIAELKRLRFKPFEFQGYLGKRRIVSFGWKYDFDRKALHGSNPIPAFLMPLRATAATFVGVMPEDLQQILINEYEASAGVGWHRDKGMFQDVVGISLSSAATFRFRRERGDAWERISRVLQPRSAYLMRGPSRWEWQHSVAPVDELRYSVTFRNFTADHQVAAG